MKYASGEEPIEGDIVVCGGDEFRVDSIDVQHELVKGAIDPTGYAVSICYLVKRHH